MTGATRRTAKIGPPAAALRSAVLSEEDQTFLQIIEDETASPGAQLQGREYSQSFLQPLGHSAGGVLDLTGTGLHA